MAEKWIQKTGISEHKGALRKALHVKEGHKIPEKKLAKAEHAKGHLGHMARLAETLKKLRHK